MCCIVAVLVTYSTAAADKAIALALWAIAYGLLLGLPLQEVSDRLSVAPLFFPPTFCQAMQKQTDPTVAQIKQLILHCQSP